MNRLITGLVIVAFVGLYMFAMSKNKERVCSGGKQTYIFNGYEYPCGDNK